MFKDLGRSETKMSSLAHAFFAHVEDTYKTYSVTKGIEMEMRVGRTKPNGTFEAAVPQVQWDNVMRGLSSYDGWEMTDHIKYTTFRGKRGVRLNEYHDSGDRVCVRKTNMEKKDFPISTGHTIRFGASTEKPVKDVPVEFDDILDRERWSFIRKNLRIDLTISTPDDKDAEDPFYEIELEFLPPYSMDRDIMFSMFYKVFDILGMMMDPPPSSPLWAIQTQP